MNLQQNIKRILREEKLHATPQELIKNLPKELKELLFKQWGAKQNPEWHPEGNTLKHIIVVIKRAYHHYPDDPNMVMAALFHDLGKIDTYKINPKTNQPTAYGHEDKSTEYVERFKDWIESFEGTDVEEIKYLVKNHMKVKPSTWNQMKDKKKEPIMSHPAFDKLMGFTDKLDGGGTHLKESIKRILKEESLKQSLIDMIKDGDFNFAVDIVGGEDEFKRILNIETPIDYLHLFDDMEVVKSKKDSDFQLFRYKNQENLMVYHIPTRIVFVSYQLFKNVLFFTEGKDDITRETETSVLSYLKQWMNEVYRLKYVVGVNAMPNKYKIMEGHSKENVLREETNIKPVLHNLLNMLFEGFDDIYYDWAEYNCGMGVCCDPYAIGFVLPGSEYDDYFFKFVEGNNYDFMGEYPKEISDELPEVCYEQPDIKDPRFDTIVFYEVFAEDIENYLGPQNNWKESLLNLINDKFGCRAWDLIII